MLVKEVRKEVLFVVRKTVEKGKEVRFVPENELCGDDARSSGFPNEEGLPIVQRLEGRY